MNDAGVIADERKMAARARVHRSHRGTRPLRTDYSGCTCPGTGDSCDPCAAYHADLETWQLVVECAADAAADLAKDEPGR